jgi:5-methylcytosine-specific restriction endonuclease McrA
MALKDDGDIDVYGPDSTFNHDTLAIIDAKGTPKGNGSPMQRTVKTLAYTEDPRVAAYALRKAKGRCGDCKKPAPFTRRATGHSFLEVHHIHILKNGGADTPNNVIALCPNCPVTESDIMRKDVRALRALGPTVSVNSQ